MRARERVHDATRPFRTIAYLLEDAHDVRMRLGVPVMEEEREPKLLGQLQQAGKVLELRLAGSKAEAVVVCL